MRSSYIHYSLLLLIAVCTRGKCSCVVSLNNASWTFSSNNNVTGRAVVPGNIYDDLERENLLQCKLLSDDCDLQLKWIPRASWVYRGTFAYPKQCLSSSPQATVFLVTEGVDTVSTINLNGFEIGRTENMFIRYKFVIPSHLLIESNVLTVEFASPIAYARTKYLDYLFKHKLSVPQFCPLPTQHGECHVNFIRKMQSSFSWDWGPSFPSVGIWKDIYLEVASDAPLFQSFSVTPMLKSNKQWYLQTQVFLEVAREHKMASTDRINLLYYLNDQLINVENLSRDQVYQEANIESANEFKVIKLQSEMKVNRNVQLWWPAGSATFASKIPIGKLYRFTIKLVHIDTNRVRSVQEKVKSIGFRTVNLIQDAVGDDGATFYFKINGKEMFMRGSNWIPSTVLPTHKSNWRRIEYLLTSAAAARMNILRVWGGGIYESDYFYDLADSLGIFIWQDLMFACSLYPGQDESFIESVSLEVTQQIRRLKSHPSILLWAGNNEIEMAIAGNWYPELILGKTRFKQDYKKLFIDTIGQVVAREDASRIYLPSSPSNGIESASSNGTSSTPNGNKYGDVHFYQDREDSWFTSTYPSARFVSEYGYQSFPSYESWLSAVTTRDCLQLPLQSCVKHRQHKFRATENLINQLRKHFSLSMNGASSSLSHFFYLTQIEQAMSVKVESEFYRLNRNINYQTGEGRTMGALYWQLNDVWIAPTWSSIDFTGRWKLLHYYAKNFLSPLLVTPTKQGQKLLIHATNDMIHPVDIITRVLLFNLTSFTPIDAINVTCNTAASSSGIIHSTDLPSTVDLVVTRTQIVNETGAHAFVDNFLLLSSLKSNSISSSNCNVRIKSITKKPHDNSYNITLASDRICLFVYLYIDDTDAWGIFDDNGFMMTQASKSITLSPQCCEQSDFSQLIRVKALNN